jgi:hypothetical protein
MTFVAEPLTVFAVAISTPQVDIAVPWMIGATVVCAICWVLVALDMRHRRQLQEEPDGRKPVVEPQRAA